MTSLDDQYQHILQTPSMSNSHHFHVNFNPIQYEFHPDCSRNFPDFSHIFSHIFPHLSLPDSAGRSLYTHCAKIFPFGFTFPRSLLHPLFLSSSSFHLSSFSSSFLLSFHLFSHSRLLSFIFFISLLYLLPPSRFSFPPTVEFSPQPILVSLSTSLLSVLLLSFSTFSPYFLPLPLSFSHGFGRTMPPLHLRPPP